MNTQVIQWHLWANHYVFYTLKHGHILYVYICVYVYNSTSYLVEALQTLLDRSKGRVWDANFDLWVLPLGVQTISHNSARITEKKRDTDIYKNKNNTGVSNMVANNSRYTGHIVDILFIFI